MVRVSMAPGVRSFLLSTAVLAVAAALVAPLAGGAVARVAALPTLYVTYANNCTFTITDDARNTVSSIAPGSYQLYVTTPASFVDVPRSASDTAACPISVQFRLTGPGVNLFTNLADGDNDHTYLTATFQ